MSELRVELNLSEDETLATIRLSGRTRPLVCEVLAVEKRKSGRRVVYLRTRIHRETSLVYRGWSLSGAITTIAEELPDVA